MFRVVAGGDDASQESVADGFDGQWQAASSEQHNGKLKKASELLGRLREDFPMFDENILAERLRLASSDFQRTTKSLSKLEKSKGVSLVPADIPRLPPRQRNGGPSKLIANVIARTDHPSMPLYCFIAMVTKALTPTQRCRAGSIVRPIPEERFRLLGDETGLLIRSSN